MRAKGSTERSSRGRPTMSGSIVFSTPDQRRPRRRHAARAAPRASARCSGPCSAGRRAGAPGSCRSPAPVEAASTARCSGKPVWKPESAFSVRYCSPKPIRLDAARASWWRRCRSSPASSAGSRRGVDRARARRGSRGSRSTAAPELRRGRRRAGGRRSRGRRPRWPARGTARSRHSHSRSKRSCRRATASSSAGAGAAGAGAADVWAASAGGARAAQVIAAQAAEASRVERFMGAPRATGRLAKRALARRPRAPGRF